MRQYFGTDGVRGLAGKELTAELAYKLGVAYGHVLLAESDEPHILLGQDTRISGDMFFHALAAGLTAVGVNVSNASVIPTPAIAYLVRRLNYDAGAMISASHNPYYDNGIKFFDHQGYKLSDEQELEIEKLIENIETVSLAKNKNIGKMVELEECESLYKHSMLQSLGGKKLDSLKIGLDCANGATYIVGPEIFEEAGAEVKIIHNEPNGVNINRDCGSTEPEDLQQFVIDNELDAGFAFDGDGDRLIAVDEKGNIIDGDQILSIIGMSMKEKGILSRNTIVATVMSNLGLLKMGEEKDVKIETTQVGDKYVLDLMREEGYNLGGEQSGHIILKDHGTTGDGILAALMLSGILAEKGIPFSEVNTEMEVLPQVLINVEVDKDKTKNFERHPSYIREARKIESDLRRTGRILVRESGTEPVIRVLVEGEDMEEIEEKAERLADVIKEHFA